MHAPFSLYKKPQPNNQPSIWYVRFWNFDQKKFTITRSTGIPATGKRERRAEAETLARTILPDIRFNTTAADRLFIEYVRDFWTPNSPYVRECADIKKKPLSLYYVSCAHDDVRRWMQDFPGFIGITLGDLTAGNVKDWMQWATKKGLSSRRVNAVLQSMRVAVRYAVRREELDRDPFRNVGEATEETKEKGILTFQEVQCLVTTRLPDIRVKVCLLLAALCGMRRGECRGLRWADIEGETIHIRNNFVDTEGAKAPKCGSVRRVPIPEPVRLAIQELKQVAPRTTESDFVLFDVDSLTHPVGVEILRKGFCEALGLIGIPLANQRTRNLTLHGLRHTYVTLGRMSGLSDMVIQALAGHKSGAMMDRYSHAGQVIDFGAARASMESALTSKAVGNE